MGYADILLSEERRRAREDRAREIATRWELYEGEHPKPLAVRPAKDGRPPVDDNVTPNLIGTFVDRSNAFLFGDPPAFSLDTPQAHTQKAAGASESSSEGDVEVSPEELYIDAVWRFNRRKTLLKKWGLNGGVAGHAFMRIVVPEPGQTAVNKQTGKPLLRLVNLDPAIVDVAWDEEDIDRVLAYLLEWRAGETRMRRQLIELQDNGTWLITDQVADGRGPYLQMRDPVAWSYPFAPIVDCQNVPTPNEYFGHSDLECGLANLNLQVNRMLSNLSRIVRFHAHPKTWASGIATRELAKVVVDPDGIIGLPHPEAQLHNLEMSSDLAGALETYRAVKSVLHEVGRVPDLSTEKLEGIGNLSGRALKLMFSGLLEVTDDKRGTYGDGLEELNRRLLAVAGLGDYDPELTVNIDWPEALPGDPLEEAQTAQLHKGLGVSEHTILEKLGYNPELEKDRSADEAEASMEQMQLTFDRGGFAGGDPGRTGGQIDNQGGQTA